MEEGAVTPHPRADRGDPLCEETVQVHLRGASSPVEHILPARLEEASALPSVVVT